MNSLTDRLRDEADQCRNDGANDIANLLDEAATAIEQAASSVLTHPPTTTEHTMNTQSFTTLPALGQPLAGGTFFGITTLSDGTHAAVVLLDNKPAKRLPWQAATDWAAQLDAQLPTRPVAALLYANAKAQFEEAWHWTNETDEDDASYAWLCDFGIGYQYNGHKSYEGCARAVRLIQLSA